MVILETLYRAKMEEFQDKLPELVDESVVYVTDLVSCSHKRVLRRRYPLLTFRFEPQAVLGDLVHSGLERLVVERNGNWRAEVPIERFFDIDGKRYRLLGRADLVEYSEEGRPKRVVEIKTARQLQGNTPYEHHVLQLKIYLELLGVDEGLLLYVTPERLVEFRVERGGVDVEELMRQTVYDLARPRFSWECRYCPFKRICPYARNSEGES